MYPSGNVTITPGRNITFTCLLVTARAESFRSITWLLNGVELDPARTNVIPQFESIGSGIGTLTFINVPLEYNRTFIECQGFLRSDRVATSDGVFLLLQGIIMCHRRF